MTSSADKRAHRRVARQFVMRVRADLKSIVPVWSLVTTHNLSAGGVLFTTDQPAHLHEPVIVKIHFLDRIIECRARVARLTPGYQKPLLQIAAEFEDMPAKDREFIAHFCSTYRPSKAPPLDFP